MLYSQPVRWVLPAGSLLYLDTIIVLLFIKGCTVLKIWLDTRKATITLWLWASLQPWPCSKLPYGGFPTHCHNEVCDILVTLITEVCYDVAMAPVLQQLTEGTFHWRITTTEDNALLDIRASGFWGNHAENTFFNINTDAPSNKTTSATACYCWHERAKRNKYEERMLDVEKATFAPLVFSTSGGASSLTTTFLLVPCLSTGWQARSTIQYCSRMAKS